MRATVSYPLAAVGILGGLLGSHAAFADKVTITSGVGSEYVIWREYSEYTSEQLLQESGMRAFAELTLSASVSPRTDLRARGRIYGGDINYDGQYQDGTPATTITEYRGLVGEAGLAYRPDLRDWEASPALILNLGADGWDRAITGPGGYEESYRMLFLRLGIEQEAQKGTWSARGGILFPLSTREKVDLYDGVTLEPKGKPGFYFGMGYRLRNGLEWMFDYQGYRFYASDVSSRPVTSGGIPVDINNDGIANDHVHQPRSELDTFGLLFRWRF